jgi:hypothetical protein
MKEYAGFEGGSAGLVDVKTGLDSVFKDVKADFQFARFLHGIRKAVKRRDVAENGRYIRWHENTDLGPQLISGSTRDCAAGPLRCVQFPG